jgi:O-antigen ligase
VHWGTGSAHNSYLEATLGTGLIGMGLALMIALGLTGRAVTLFRATGDVGIGFLVAVMAYGLINGISESGFMAPSFTPWIVGAGLLQLAFFAPGPNEAKYAVD